MKKLETTITFKGDLKGETAELIQRNENVAIYKLGERNYEVFKIKIQQPNIKIIAGREVTFEHKELYGQSSQWGESAFTCPSLEKAIERFNQLSKI